MLFQSKSSKTYSDDECLFLQKNTTAPTMIKIAGMAITIPTIAPKNMNHSQVIYKLKSFKIKSITLKTFYGLPWTKM